MINLALGSRYVIDAFDTLFIVIPNCNCAELSPKCTLTNLLVDSLNDRIAPMHNHATQFDYRSWQGTLLFGGRWERVCRERDQREPTGTTHGRNGMEARSRRRRARVQCSSRNFSCLSPFRSLLLCSAAAPQKEVTPFSFAAPIDMAALFFTRAAAARRTPFTFSFLREIRA